EGTNNGVIYHTALPPGAPRKAGKRLYIRRDNAANNDGGVAPLKLFTGPNRARSITIRSYAEFSAAEQHTRVTVLIASAELPVKADWKQLKRGWSLTEANLS